jgi:diguanylate cyclase (GGDEF)-like protein
LRTYLIWLTLASFVPALLLAVFAVWQATTSYREASAQRLTESARTLARSFENDFLSREQLLQMLAAAAPDGHQDNATLTRWLNQAAPDTGALMRFSAADLAGAPLLPSGAPPLAFLRAALASSSGAGKASVSNLYFADGVPQVAFALPDPDLGGRAGRLLVFATRPDRLLRLAGQAGASSTSLLVAIVDGTGHIVARSRDNQRYVGRRVPDWDTLLQLGAGQRLFNAQTTEGPQVIFAYDELIGTPGWVLVVGEPLDAFNARWKQPLWQLLIGGVPMLMLALVLAAWLARRILQPVRSLERDARAVADHDATQHGARDAATEGAASGLSALLPLPALSGGAVTHIREFESMRTSIEAAQTALHQRAVQERDTRVAIARSELRYRTLAHAGALVLWRAEAGVRLTAVLGWQSLTGEVDELALGQRWLERVHAVDRSALLERLNSDTRNLDIEFRIADATQLWRWVRARGSLVPPSGGHAAEWVGVLEDVHERRQAQDRIAYMAQHDALTGLLNRAALQQRLEAAVQRAGRGEPSAVLYLDLDRFKEVNDTLGHPVGDALLRAVTRRLQQHVRDIDVVARLGGDEFVVIYTMITSEDAVAVMAGRLVEALGAPYVLGEHQANIGASVGIALITSGSDDPDRTLKCADLALYRAKQEGRGRYYFFDEDMDARLQLRKKMEQQLRRALERDEFELSYLQQRHPRLRTLAGIEALLHWKHSEHGLLPAADFAALADESKLTAELCQWTLRRACRDLSGLPHCPKVSINVSASVLRYGDFVGIVAQALEVSGLAPERLELAVNESVFLGDTQKIMATLTRVRKLGVRITMDNFGAGYASLLGHLRGGPFGQLKFGLKLASEPGLVEEWDAAQRAVAGLCASLGIKVAARDVNDEEHLAALGMDRYEEIQGRICGEPVPVARVA